jgi:hypothetical protein
MVMRAPRILESQNEDPGAGAQQVAPPDESDQSFGPGSTSRKALIVWLGATLWLVIVWRAVEGY